MLIVHKPSRRTPMALLIGAALAVVAAGIWWQATRPGAELPPAPPPPAAAGAPTARVVTPHAGLPSAGKPLPPSPEALEDPARVFELGFAGGLVVDSSTVSALDQLQGMLGDQPTEGDVAALEHRIRQGLPREEADKAIKLFQGYRGYTQAMRADVMAMGIPQDREAADALLARVDALQHRHFDAPSSEALFGEQNRLSKAVLDASLVQLDGGLTEAQKKQQLDAIRASLPEAQRHAIPDVPADAPSAPQ